MSATRTCSRCSTGTETCMIANFWKCDRCDVEPIETKPGWGRQAAKVWSNAPMVPVMSNAPMVPVMVMSTEEMRKAIEKLKRSPPAAIISSDEPTLLAKETENGEA